MTLFYQFPERIVLDEVKELVATNSNFIIVDKGEYLVASYIRMGNDTFPPVVDRGTAILRELRGLIFNRRGDVIARRPHKFFNVGERADVQFDVRRPHVLLEKLDGSMITPIPLDSGIQWGTKMGVTDVALQAKQFIDSRINYHQLALFCECYGVTPTFEWCSRQQRIVIDYPVDQLVLLLVRDNVSGSYWSHEDVLELAKEFDVPVVALNAFDRLGGTMGGVDDIIAQIRTLDEAEGVVVRWDDGHMAKIKADKYVSLHRAKSLLDNERDVVDLIIQNKVDDLYPLLPEADPLRLRQFATSVWEDIAIAADTVYDMLWTEHAGKDRKQFALATINEDPVLRSIAFRNFDVQSARIFWVNDSIEKYVLQHLGSAGAYEKIKKSILTRSHWKVNQDD